jgi:2-polyprenyl-3-methyl-5-hydroxy-6-metoxy-1,4-benzoquinol methylase
MPPSDWLVAHEALLPASGAALDLACGIGRHALWLAERGLHVRALDRDAAAITALSREAVRRHLTIDAQVLDLEDGQVDLGHQRYDVTVVFSYLHRPLMPSIIASIRPGGLLFYETFTRAQARRGKPTNPAFLLEAGELRRLTVGLELLDGREGEFGGRDIASAVCRKP